MTTGIRSDASGTFGALTFGGDDAVTFDATGIKAGSYKAGSIVAADFADGALIENAPVGIGYGPGAGGTVTQATSKSTAVTLNKPSGKINMAAGAIASGAAIQFQLINSCITGGDTIDVVVASGISAIANYTISKYVNDAGGCYISLRNNSASSLDELIVLKFNVMKGANS